MNRYMGIAVIALAVAFSFNAAFVGNASALDTPDPVQLLQEQANEETELNAIFNTGGETELQYRVFETEEELNYEGIAKDAGAA